MNVDRRLIACVQVCDHGRLARLALISIVTSWEWELVLVIVLKQIHLLLVKEFDALLRVA